MGQAAQGRLSLCLGYAAKKRLRTSVFAFSLATDGDVAHCAGEGRRDRDGGLNVHRVCLLW